MESWWLLCTWKSAPSSPRSYHRHRRRRCCWSYYSNGGACCQACCLRRCCSWSYRRRRRERKEERFSNSLLFVLYLGNICEWFQGSSRINASKLWRSQRCSCCSYCRILRQRTAQLDRQHSVTPSFSLQPLPAGEAKPKCLLYLTTGEFRRKTLDQRAVEWTN